MPTHLKKTRKLRGHVSMGYGRVGKHRKHPAGRGTAGGEHHQRINMFKYHPGYYGKKGIRVFREHKNREFCQSINVDQLWGLVSEQTKEKFLNKKTEESLLIDCVSHGFFKVTGRGRLPKTPLVVRAKYFSSDAQRKIRAVGGACQIVA